MASSRYSGWDEGTNESLVVASGATVTVSQKKADQLLCDFPYDWEVLSQQPRARDVSGAAKIAVQLCGPRGTSVRNVMESLAKGLRRLRYDVRTVDDGQPARPDEVLVTWGVWRARRGHERMLTIIDPVDGWRLSPNDVRQRNDNVHISFGLSRYSTEALKRLGVCNAEPLPLGVDWSEFHRTPKAVLPGRLWTNCKVFGPASSSGLRGRGAEAKFWFLHQSAVQARKGVPDLVHAFCQEFGSEESVGLVIKALHNKAWGIDMISTGVLGDLLKEHASHPPIVYSWTDLSVDEMRQLYSAAGCYVSASRLEGWGLPPLEAMACGTPTIVTDFSGHRDYANAENAYLVPCREESMAGSAMENGLTAEVAARLTWGRPSIDDLRKAMRLAYEECRGGVSSKRLEAMARTARWFTSEHSAMRLVEAIERRGVKLARKRFVKHVKDEDLPTVTVGIPTLNYRDLLKRCIETLRQTTGVDITVVVWDDGSRDGTREMVEAEDWGLRLVYKGMPVRKGLPLARKVLADLALRYKTEFLCYLDADIEVTDPQWLAKLCALHVDGISTGRLLLPDGRVWAAGCRLDEKGMPGLLGYNQPNSPEYDRAKLLDYAPGALMFMRADLFKRGVEVDLSYDVRAYDDVDLCFQVTKRIGEHCWYWPEVTLTHNSWSYRPHKREELAQHRDEFIRSERHFCEKWGYKPWR